MIDIFTLWDEMEAEELEAKKKALEVKRLEEETAQYSPEPKEIKKPPKKEVIEDNGIQSDLPEPKPTGEGIDGGDSV